MKKLLIISMAFACMQMQVFGKHAIIVLAKRASCKAMSVMKLDENTVRVSTKDFDEQNVDEALFGSEQEERCAQLQPSIDQQGVYEVTYLDRERVEDIRFRLEVVDHDLEVVRVLVISEDELAQFTMMRSGILTVQNEQELDDPFADDDADMFDMDVLEDTGVEFIPEAPKITTWKKMKVLTMLAWISAQGAVKNAGAWLHTKFF